jgi:hypothetical protein
VNRALRLLIIGCAALAAVLPAGVPAAAAPPGQHPRKEPWPVTLTVRTVPPLPGIKLTLDGQPQWTDDWGYANWTQEHNFAAHTLTLVDAKVELPDQHYRFTRWAGQRDPNQAFNETVTGLPMRRNYMVTAAFTVQYPVGAKFVDNKGRPLDPDRISAVKIRSDTGQVMDLPKTGTVWLDGTQPVYRKSELVENDVSYSLQSITVSGTNIVDAGRQRFSPAKGASVTLAGQFHDLTVRAHDAIYQGSVAGQARVTCPDGTVQTVPLGPDHTATLHNLPRGRYSVTVVSGGGLVLADEFILSRDKELDLPVVSRADLGTIGVAAVLVAVGLLLAGRSRLRRRLRAVAVRAVRGLTSRTPAPRRAADDGAAADHGAPAPVPAMSSGEPVPVPATSTVDGPA